MLTSGSVLQNRVNSLDNWTAGNGNTIGSDRGEAWSGTIEEGSWGNYEIGSSLGAALDSKVLRIRIGASEGAGDVDGGCLKAERTVGCTRSIFSC